MEAAERMSDSLASLLADPSTRLSELRDRPPIDNSARTRKRAPTEFAWFTKQFYEQRGLKGGLHTEEVSRAWREHKRQRAAE